MDLQYATATPPVTIAVTAASTKATLAANAATAITAATGSSIDNLGAVTAGLKAASTWVAAKAVVLLGNVLAGYAKVPALGLLGGLEKPAST